MKKIILFVMVLFSMNLMAQENKALLIIAHGSPSADWNRPVLDLENQISDSLKEKGINEIKMVKVAFIESAHPSVAQVISEMEKQGITMVYALPLFISLSGHSVFDVPALLGLYYTREEEQALQMEKSEIVNTNLKITLGPTLSYQNVMKDILLDRVKAMSVDPANEALVLLAHGSEDFNPVWNNLLQETGNYILGKTGILYFDHAFVEAGQSFTIDGMPVILKASEMKKRVLVLGVYVSMGVKKMAENSGLIIMGHTLEAKKMLEGKAISFADQGLLPDRRINQWIVDRATEWINR